MKKIQLAAALFLPLSLLLVLPYSQNKGIIGTVARGFKKIKKIFT